MPELPEVENVVRTLRPGLIGRRILAVEMAGLRGGSRRTPALRRILSQSADEFRKALCGAAVEDVRRYGKHIQVALSETRRNGKVSLWVHLGMTGRLTWESTPEFLDRHTHIVFSLDAPGRWLHYNDIRQFGRLRVSSNPEPAKAPLGPDPLQVSFEDFFRMLRSRSGMMKALLLNQQFLRGLGNIYADESLFTAGIHPQTISSRLNRARAQRLYEAIQETLRVAIDQGGSSISDYVDAEGRFGQFQKSHRVYRRTGLPCMVCSAPVRRIVVASRSTHFCPKCQTRSGRSTPRSNAARGARR